MKTQINFDEPEKKIDFETVGKKLPGLAGKGDFRREKTVTDLPDGVREALHLIRFKPAARRHRVAAPASARAQCAAPAVSRQPHAVSPQKVAHRRSL